MRDRPAGIDAVAREAAADLVVDATAGHRMQRGERHLASVPQQQELQHGRLRKSWPTSPAAEAAVARVEALSQLAHRLLERAMGEWLGRRRQLCPAGQALPQALAAGVD